MCAGGCVHPDQPLGGLSVPAAELPAFDDAGRHARARERGATALALPLHPRGAVLGSTAGALASPGRTACCPWVPWLWTRRLPRLGTFAAQPAVLAARVRECSRRRLAADATDELEAERRCAAERRDDEPGRSSFAGVCTRALRVDAARLSGRARR